MRVTLYTLTFRCSEGERIDSEITPHAAQLATEARQRAERDYIAADCRSMNVGNLTVSQCGLGVFEEVWSEEDVTRFFSRVCKLEDEELDSERVPAECVQRLWRKWFARLSERYYLMDASDVHRKCDAYPEECENLHTFERWCLDSHNDHVVARFRAEQDELQQLAVLERSQHRAELIRKQAAEEQRARAEADAIADALGEMGARMQGKKVFRCSRDGSKCWQE
jgi:hypothetical protein